MDSSLHDWKISVIVLNYNGLDFLPKCIESLKKTTYSPLELVVIDNNSTDTSLEYLHTHHPEVKLFPIKENLGFSGAYNKIVPEISSEIVVLLNFDVEVEPKWLDQAVELLKSDSTIAAVQPKLKSYQNRNLLEYAGGCGGFMDKLGYPFARGRVFDTLEEDDSQYDDVRDVFWASGAALIMRKSAYLESGGLDDDFFMHMEEIDMCWRLWMMGMTVKAAPSGIVYHFSGAALSATSYKKMYLNHRNSLIMLLKNYSATNLFKYFPLRIVLDWFTIFSAPFLGQYKRSFAVIHSHIFVLTHFPKLLLKRKKTQQLRKVSDSKFSSLIFPLSIVWRYFFSKQKTFSKIMAAR